MWKTDNIYWVNRRAAAGKWGKIAGLGKTRRNSRISPRRRGTQAPVKQVTLTYMLQQTGRRMEPFYRRVATDESYARRFCEALAESDLEKIEQMLKEASPKIGHTYPGTSGIGIFVGLPFGKPIEIYTNGTTLSPGTTQLTFQPEAFQRISRAILPLYHRFARYPVYTGKLARALQKKDPEAAVKLLRAVVKDEALRSMTVVDSGVILRFRFPFTRYTCLHMLTPDEA